MESSAIHSAHAGTGHRHGGSGPWQGKAAHPGSASVLRSRRSTIALLNASVQQLARASLASAQTVIAGGQQTDNK